MKRTIFQLFNLLMACIVLLSSTGFGLIEHTCLMRGKNVSIAINREAQQSCPIHSAKAHSKSHYSQQTPVLKRTDCCKEAHRYENVDFSSSITQLVAKFIKSLADTALAGVAALVTWLLNNLIAVETDSGLTAIESPPLHYGRSLLSFVQSFLL